ncbi:MAG: hypothetical protein LBG71_02010 [Clostridiales Family XIII bacterium]|nr:hypothetical protein [Clostridiales Family XIII bacterium]
MIEKDGCLWPDRLWAEFKVGYKCKEFEEMYKKCVKWIKKHCRISEDKFFYIAENTYKAHKEEGLVLKGNPKMIVVFP